MREPERYYDWMLWKLRQEKDMNAKWSKVSSDTDWPKNIRDMHLKFGVHEWVKRKLQEKEKKLTKRKIVVSYILIGAVGYTLGYLSSKEDLKNWAWKKENKKDDWKRK